MISKILVFTDWYYPGYKAGGPIRSCINFAECMSVSYGIFVFTSDRDLNDRKPYTNVLLNTWVTIAKNISVYYASSGLKYFYSLRSNLKNVKPDFIYLNSMFSLKFTILPLL